MVTVDTNGATCYLDGAVEATKSWTGTPTSVTTSQGLLSGVATGNAYLPASVDELSISSVARSSNWIWATWHNTASNSAFQTYGRVIPNKGTVVLFK
jgi:hypothetical protein